MAVSRFALSGLSSGKEYLARDNVDIKNLLLQVFLCLIEKLACFNHVSGFFSDHDGWGVGVACDQCWHD